MTPYHAMKGSGVADAAIHPPRQPVPAMVETALAVRLRTLAGLDADDLTAVDRLCQDRRRMRARMTAVQQGRLAERLFVVLEGWACSYRLLPDGRRQINQVMVPGDFCNLSTLHLRQTGTAIGTLTPCTLAAVDPRALRDLAGSRRPIAEALAWIGAVDQAGLAERNTSLGRRSAREHVAHLICELLVRLTAVGQAKGNGYVMPLTQEEIGDVLGLTSVHVNRVVQGLRRDGLIEYVGKDMIVMQWSVLRSTASFRADYLFLEGIDGTATDFSAAPWAFAPPPPPAQDVARPVRAFG